MMLRKKIGIIAIIAVLCLAMFAFAACSKDGGTTPGEDVIPNPPGPTVETGPLSAVVESSITVTESDTAIYVLWGDVRGAQTYVVTVAGKTYTANESVINLLSYNDFVLPANGELAISIVAKADGRTDSPSATKTYKTEGVVLRSPEIISVQNGRVEWRAVPGASAYILNVNGMVISDGADGLYRSTTYDASAVTSAVTITITAVGDGVWYKNSVANTVVVNPSSGVVAPAPITGYTVTDGVLSWPAKQDVTKYRVVDVDFNTLTVEGTEYDMTGSNLIYGVYPYDSSLSIELVPVDIEYLEGKGTEAEPYLIKTPFDLRAIDYYETLYAEQGGTRNRYRIENDIDYNTVVALEEESNIYTLHKPFFGILDGNGKKLSNVKVNYDGGYWSLFDFIAAGATVKDIILDRPEITNKLIDYKHPLNASIAAIAYVNNGTVSGITLKDAVFSAQAGGVSGIVSRNYGTVSGCTVSGSLIQLSTSEMGSAAYEMAGVVLENSNGGIVENNTVTTLTIRGTGGNIRSSAGVVSINRAGGIVRNNNFQTVTITNMDGNSEYGGIVAYSKGTVTKGTGTLGTLTVGGSPVTGETGGASGRGKLVGKSEV